jgi:hypothetical protein
MEVESQFLLSFILHPSSSILQGRRAHRKGFPMTINHCRDGSALKREARRSGVYPAGERLASNLKCKSR